ncbi:hypothetical protein [Streptomyces sp. JJ36]|uniref:hypothetical protein n=1 Tax=Streptomyces sp. JJ36 TaxID=2736645 RepID=UPI001F423303|nr:hypothetical protein [Streptomyces sp. JJ36]MCF6526604.1 hypothetical protein [Streptomyces sp. JJ36]
MRMRGSGRGMRAAVVAAALVAGTAACSGGSDGSGDEAKPRKSGGGQKSETAALIEKTNKVMAATSFHASGTSTAFGGARQEIWWDPDAGMRMTVEADGGSGGEMYCKDGKSYISAPLLAETLGQRGQEVSVPAELTGSFVTVEASGEGCEAYFAVPESGKRVPEKDGAIEGRKSLAIAAGDSRTADVYHLAASGESRVLRMESRREGVQASTTYEGYGAEYTVELPPAEKQVPMAEFQQRIAAGAE